MAISRRSLLTAGLGLPLAARPGLAFASSGPSPLAVGASAESRERFAVRMITGQGADGAVVDLPGRGHGAAWRYSAGEVPGEGAGEVVILARRPGRFAVVIDVVEGRIRQRFETPQSRHFYGHGVFSRDGRRLFATENDFDGGRGVIGVYDAENGYRRLGELPSHGIGPHELALLSDGRRLVVANGGIRTHPDSGRRKLNLATMAPNLAYVDSDSGALLQRFSLPEDLHLLSIRHLAVSRDDAVCLALQNEGPRNRLVPLVGFQRDGTEIALAETPAAVLKSMRHYCGSAALDESGRYLAVSAPRGGRITFWSTRERRYLAEISVADGCGLAPAGGAGRFFISSGQGRLFIYDLTRGRETALHGGAPGLAWDNHLLAL